ncbi:MAG: T9SS type A sorting domain-containing protein, partial [Bacteroidota bacterium]|nr:T9SS type A sorting domain-containing protein [Bacteroidota bacterium]
YVYGYNGAFDNNQCYTLNIQLSATNFSPDLSAPALKNATTIRQGLKVYPVPASSSLTVSFDAYKRGTADIIITNRLGQQILHKNVGVDDGINITNLDVSKITPGMYFLKVINGEDVQMKKLMIGR